MAIISAEARITSSAELKAFEAVGKKFDQLAAAGRRVDQVMAKFATGARSIDMFGRSFEALSVSSRHIDRIGHSFTNVERRITRAERAMQAFGRASHAAARAGGNVAIAAGGLFAGYGAKQVAKKAVVSAAEFDIGVRKQREFTDISEAAQRRILIPQAKKIGQDTQFSNLDVTQAQTTAMQGLPSSITGDIKAEIAAGMLENVKHYALIMEADLKTSAEAIRSYLQTTNKNISTKEKAITESEKAVNQLVRMAKLGGMDDNDVQEFLKFGAASGSVAGLDNETMMSLGALARRGGLRGSEAGVFMRSASSKLVAPTKQGITALNSAGIRYSDYVNMPSRLDADRLEAQFKQDLGKGFSPATKARLSKIMSDPKVLGDRGAFTAAVTQALGDQFGTKAADRSKVAKSAGAFHKTSAASVRSQDLLDRIMESDMTLAQLNAFFTDKHGGKAAITQRQREEYVAGRRQLRAAGDDPQFAKRKADEIMGGLGGSFERLKGSVDNLILAMGDAQAERLKAAFDRIGNTLDAISNISQPTMQFATELGAATAALVAYTAAVKASDFFRGGVPDGGTPGGGKPGRKAPGFLKRLGWIGTAITAFEYGPDFFDWSKGAVGPTDGSGPGDPLQRAYDAAHPKDTLERLRRERANRNARRPFGGPEVTQTMTYGTGVGGAQQLSGTLEGDANVRIKIEAPELIKAYYDATTAMKMVGRINQNGPGSTGRSSPDAQAPGGTGFGGGGM